MNWTQRYLQALKAYLPAEQSKDICDELEATLLDQLEERDASNSEEKAANAKAIIAELGHPALYASGFQSQQALISQPLLEIYKQTLRWLIWVLIGLFSAIELIDAFYSGHFRPIAMVFHIVDNCIDYFVWSFALITATFYFAEPTIKKLTQLDAWKPDDLPQLQPDWNKISQSESAFGVVTYTLFSAWMFGLIEPFNTWKLSFSSNPVSDWYELIMPALGVIAILFALHRLYLCFVPYWQKPTLAMNLVLNGCTFAVVAILLALPTEQLPVFVSEKEGIQTILTILSQSARWALIVVAGYALYEIVRDGFRWSKVP